MWFLLGIDAVSKLGWSKVLNFTGVSISQFFGCGMNLCAFLDACSVFLGDFVPVLHLALFAFSKCSLVFFGVCLLRSC